MQVSSVLQFLFPGVIIGSVLGSAVLMMAVLFLSRDKNAPNGLALFGVAFGVNALRILSFLTASSIGPTASMLLSETLHVACLLLFLEGCWRFLGMPVRSNFLLTVGVTLMSWLLFAVSSGFGFKLATVPFYAAAALLHAFIALQFYTVSKKQGLWGGRFVALTFFLWGLHKLNYPWLRPSEIFAPIGFAVAEILAASSAVGLLLMAQRRLGERAEHALRSAEDSQRRFLLSEKHLTTVLHGMSDGVVTLDPQGVVLAANPAAAAMFGLDAKLAVGMEFDRLVPGGDAMAQSLIVAGQGNPDGMARGFECLGIRQDGSHVPLEMIAAELPFENGSFKIIKVKDTSDTKFAVRVEDLMVSLSGAFVEGEGVGPIVKRLADGIAAIFCVPLVWVDFRHKDGRSEIKAVAGTQAQMKELGGVLNATGLADAAQRTGAMQFASVGDNPFGVMLDGIWNEGFKVASAIPLTAHSNVVAVLNAASQTDHFPPTFLTTLDKLSERLGLIVQAVMDQERLELMAAAMEAASSAIVIADSKGGIEWANAAFCRTSGYGADEVGGRKLNLLAVKDQGGSEFAELKKALDSGSTWHGEMVERRKDGSLYTVEQTVTPMLDGKGHVTHYVVVQEDLTEKRRAEERIRFLSNYDTLTALPNRQLFHERLESAVRRALESGLELALLFVDLDQFSRVNDTLGHAAGDKLLIGVVERLRIAARAADTLARIGGDEFGIVLIDAKASELAANLASRINSVVAEPFKIDGHEARVGANVGIAVLPSDGVTTDELVRNVDLALYRCIREHPGGYRFFSQDMNDEARQRLGLERDLRRAVEKNEFILHYQPQLDAKTGRIIGFEALVRWQHPEKGLIAPGQFIPVAEDTGLIVPLGEWVLVQACRQAKIWKDKGLGPVTMAVNISAVQFFRQDVVGVVKRILADSQLDPSWLELELTESMVMHDAEAAIHTLERLNQLGLKMSIDDFGTGYSSLNYLRRFPVHRLKIDQSFVRELANSPNDAEIARAIISLGHSLELEVVSEGVETQAQLDYLKREGADLLQGFLFSRPVAVDAASDLLARQPFEWDFS